MATGLVAQRSRAAERVNRISVNLDRSTGYMLGNINATPASVAVRRGRDSSIGTLGRNNLETVKYRDSSITRGGGNAARHSMMILPSTETAKYNRQQAIEDIHSNFMKNYKETNNKLYDRNSDNDPDRKSKAYQKIISNAPPSYMDDREAKRQCVSEMFMDTSKFSTKTLSAINGLEGAVIRKSKEYNWRKEMEQYEKRAEYERDVRARNVTALHRNETEEDKMVRKRHTIADKPAVKREDTEKQESQTVKSWRERREAAKAAEAEANAAEPERKSWREKLAEKQAKEEEEKKIKAAEAAAAAKAAAEAKATAEANAAAAPSGDDQTTAVQQEQEEDEDASGNKKLKADFNFMMSGLEAEMEAGRSKLAKLRERIRKAKAAVKEADDAIAADDKERAERIAAIRKQKAAAAK